MTNREGHPSSEDGMRSDTNFDCIAGEFEEEVYGSSKGYVRLNVLWEDLLSGIPEIAHGGLRVLDAGGGAGHVALRIASFGNTVVLCDPSREMLGRAEANANRVGLTNLVTVVHSSIQDLEGSIGGRFDVITCHAVLEWLANPKVILGKLVEFLKEDGRLSLMFYNRNAALLKQILRGESTAALQEREQGGSPRKWGDEATPLAEEIVRGWLDEFGLEVEAKAGIRIFHDHLPDAARRQGRLGDLLETEKELRDREPFASLGQHVHLVCKRVR